MDLRLALVEIKIEYIILMLKNNFLEKDYFHNVGRWLQGQGRFQNLYTEGALKLKTFLRYWFLIINEKLYNIFCERGGGTCHSAAHLDLCGVRSNTLRTDIQESCWKIDISLIITVF